MNRHEQRIVRFLSQPEHYPHPVRSVMRYETHVSHVFVAGAFAYKLKKPVRFSFVDTATLARRRHYCRLELSLNRSLAPTTYLEVVPVVESGHGLRLGGKGIVVEWLVKMRRLPADRMLDWLVARGRVGSRSMLELADHLNAFFKRAPRSRRIDRYGKPAQVAELLLGNLRDCRPFVGTLLSEPNRQFIETAYRQFLALHGSLLERRVRERRIIEGHGDLRCENICMTEPVTVFDCAEAQAAFRCGDLANDLSFLLMDLESRGRKDLAGTLRARYLRVFRDSTFDVVLPVYKCHRSLVRGKVRGLASQQHSKTAEGRRIRTLARRHFQLAAHYAREFSRPRLIVIGGTVGTGKSTLARYLAVALGATWLRTDEIRLREFARFHRPNQGFSNGLYASHVSQLVYQRLIRRAEKLVRRGHSVVCDGMFSKVAGRDALREVAGRHGAAFHFFECVVPKRVALRRLARRSAARSDLSEALPEHYDRLTRGFEPVRGWPSSIWTRLADNRAPGMTQRAALEVLRRAWDS